MSFTSVKVFKQQVPFDTGQDQRICKKIWGKYLMKLELDWRNLQENGWFDLDSKRACLDEQQKLQ